MTDEEAMRCALDQAALAALAGEVPVGAVVLQGGILVTAAHNAPITRNDPSAHAEILALRVAGRRLGNYRLPDCELFVTLEPCAMCAGALLNARLRRVVFAAFDPKTGAAGSVIDLFASRQINHHTRVQGGLMAADSANLLQNFFGTRRSRQADAKTIRAEQDP